MSVVLLTFVALADRLKCSPKVAQSLAKRLRLPTHGARGGKLLVGVDLADPLICLATVAAVDDAIMAWLARSDVYEGRKSDRDKDSPSARQLKAA